jgi:hypothetical protein
LRSIIGIGLGLIQLATGASLLLTPRAFYDLVPGVAETGPFNPHFARDAGAAFLVAASGLFWTARDRSAWPAAAAAAGFLGLHALIHVWDGLAGRETAEHLVVDLPLLIGFALLALWLAWSARHAHNRQGGSDA